MLNQIHLRQRQPLHHSQLFHPNKHSQIVTKLPPILLSLVALPIISPNIPYQMENIVHLLNTPKPQQIVQLMSPLGLVVDYLKLELC